MLTFVVIALVVLQPSPEGPQTASGSPAAPAEAGEAGCDPATITRDDPAAGGIGGESLRSADPQHVYDLAKSFRAVGERDSAPEFAYWLHSLAMKRDLPEAIFDDAVTRLDDRDRLNRVTVWHALRRIAMRGYLPALNEIVTRLREGRAYPPDDAELFFWLLRSQQAGVPVDDEIGRVQLRLSAELQAWVRHWLERKEWPSELRQ